MICRLVHFLSFAAAVPPRHLPLSVSGLREVVIDAAVDEAREEVSVHENVVCAGGGVAGGTTDTGGPASRTSVKLFHLLFSSSPALFLLYSVTLMPPRFPTERIQLRIVRSASGRAAMLPCDALARAYDRLPSHGGMYCMYLRKRLAHRIGAGGQYVCVLT